MAKEKKIVMTEENGAEMAGLILERIEALESKLANYPDISDEQMKDGVTYGILNGKLEIVAGENEVVITDDADTALSLALEALSTERLKPMDEEMAAEVRELLGEELFDQFDANSMQTMEEETPATDPKEVMAQAKEFYYKRKAEMAKGLLPGGSDSTDVEQDKTV